MVIVIIYCVYKLFGGYLYMGFSLIDVCLCLIKSFFNMCDSLGILEIGSGLMG